MDLKSREVLSPRENVELAPFTTLELGGKAEFFAEAHSEPELTSWLAWAEARSLPVTVLGGGSNVVVADSGISGLVLRPLIRGIEFFEPDEREESNIVRAHAGEIWDDFVTEVTERGYAGVECLAGIPGLVGAAPIQNIGAYGQEVSETIASVRIYDLATRSIQTLDADACSFRYRDSALKRRLGTFVVLSVDFRLRVHGLPSLRYAELTRAAEALGDRPGLVEIRDLVKRLRAKKSMLISDDDPNRRSAGSFFTNPIVSVADADALVRNAVSDGVVEREGDVPQYEAGEGQRKLAAAWLIERSGTTKGERHGAVGVSSKHCLSLVHHGGGRTEALVALALELRDRVERRFGIRLEPEPVRLGFACDPFA